MSLIGKSCIMVAIGNHMLTLGKCWFDDLSEMLESISQIE